MSQEIQNSRKVYKGEIFEKYAYWKFLPAQLRNQPQAIIEKHGILDEEVLELLKIPNQKEFAKQFKIGDPGTLSDWNKKLLKENPIPYIQFWSKFLSGNVMFAQYKRILKNGNGNDVRTWFGINENY